MQTRTIINLNLTIITLIFMNVFHYVILNTRWTYNRLNKFAKTNWNLHQHNLYVLERSHGILDKNFDTKIV